MKHSILAPVALAAAVGLAGEANAQEIALRNTRPAAESVEWTGPATSPNLVTSTIDATRKELTVVATTNAPVVLHGACPAPSSYPEWKLATETATAGMDSGKLVSTSTIRTGANGTFDIHTTTPSRPGSAELQLACVRKEQKEVTERKENRAAGPDGTLNTRDNIVTYEDVKKTKEVVQREVLKATLTSVATTPDGSAIILVPAGSFQYRDRDADGRARETEPKSKGGVLGTPVMVQLGGGATFGLSEAGVGGGVTAGLGLGITTSHGTLPLELIYRMGGSVPQVVNGADGKPKTVTGTSNCGFAGLGGHLGDTVRAVGSVGLGGCLAEVIHTSTGGTVDGKGSAAARVSAGVAVHGEHIGLGVTGDAVLGTDPSSRFAGIGGVFSADF
ncbi:hypothetical protein HZA42_06015 [Candidatus Peregrinibacteria bacterium]|nr:hypothetical protein [Candidatus Peregrinibacteria bacterium]